MLSKSRQILVKFVLGDSGKGTGFDMDDPHIGAKMHNARCAFVCPPGKDINGCLAMTQLTGQFTHIDVHAARILCTSWTVQRRRMDAKHSYRKTHSEYAPLLLL